jgi:hypothetical protein
LKTPIIHKDCEDQAYFDFDVYFDMFKAAGYDFSKVPKPCTNCIAPITNFADLILDECLQNLLIKYLAHQLSNTWLNINLREQNIQIIDLNERT